MRFTINERRDIHFVRADEAIDGNLDAWRSFASSHTSSIQEINSLASDAKTKETTILKDRTRSLLPNANINSIIDDGLMRNASDPYRGYLENMSARWLRSSAEDTIASHFSEYRDRLNQQLNNSKQDAKLGTYSFRIASFRLPVVRTNKNTVTILFQIDLEAQVTLIADDTTVNVDNDAIGLRDLFDGIKDVFLAGMIPKLRDDIEPAYNTLAMNFRDANQTEFFGQVTSIIGTAT